MLGVAESCTGGLLAARLTDGPGASEWFAGGAVAYSDESKTEILGVDPELIEEHGAVSPEVAEAMADGALGALRRRRRLLGHRHRRARRRHRGEAGRLRLLLRQARDGGGAAARHRPARRPQRHPPALDRGGAAPAPLPARGTRAAAMSRGPASSSPSRSRSRARRRQGSAAPAGAGALARSARRGRLGARHRPRLRARALRALARRIRLRAPRAAERARQQRWDGLHLLRLTAGGPTDGIAAGPAARLAQRPDRVRGGGAACSPSPGATRSFPRCPATPGPRTPGSRSTSRRWPTGCGPCSREGLGLERYASPAATGAGCIAAADRLRRSGPGRRPLRQHAAHGAAEARGPRRSAAERGRGRLGRAGDALAAARGAPHGDPGLGARRALAGPDRLAGGAGRLPAREVPALERLGRRRGAALLQGRALRLPDDVLGHRRDRALDAALLGERRDRWRLGPGETDRGPGGDRRLSRATARAARTRTRWRRSTRRGSGPSGSSPTCAAGTRCRVGRPLRGIRGARALRRAT